MKINPLALYLIVSFGFSWVVAAIMWNLGGLTSSSASAFLLLYMCGPGLAGLICAAKFHKGEIAAVLGLKGGWNLWLLLAWLFGLAIVIGATLISGLAASGFQAPLVGLKAMTAEMGLEVGDALDISGMNWILIGQAAILGAVINTPLMLSEELGWRGWLWHHLRPKGFWTATVLIGLMWGLWHIPVIAMGHNYPGMPIWGPVLFTLFCLLYAPIFSYVRERSGAVWAACVLHGTGNASAGVGIMMLVNPDMPWRGVVGIGGFIVMAVVALLVWLAMRDKTIVRTKA